MGKQANDGEETRTLLGTVEEGAALLEALVDFDDVAASEKLHDETRGHDGRDTELHEGTAIRCENDTHLVEGIGAVGGDDAVEGDLAADQEDEQRHGRPQHFLPEGNLLLSLSDLG